MYTARMDPSPQESPDEARVLGGDPGAGRQEEVHSRPNSGSAHRGDGGDGRFADLCEPVMGSAHALGPVMLRGIFAGPLQEMTRPEQNVPPAPRTPTAPPLRGPARWRTDLEDSPCGLGVGERSESRDHPA